MKSEKNYSKIKREKLLKIVARDKKLLSPQGISSFDPSLIGYDRTNSSKIPKLKRDPISKEVLFNPMLTGRPKKLAELYLRNGMVMVDKRKSLKNPKTRVSYSSDEAFRYWLKPGITNLNRDDFNLAKVLHLESPFKRSLELPVKGDIVDYEKFQFGGMVSYAKGEATGEKGDLLHLRNKRRLNFSQKDFNSKKNIRKFYKISKNSFRCVGSSENVLKTIERRLDILLLRLGFGTNLHNCRELIKKGYVSVDGRVANSYKLIVDVLSTVKVVSPKSPFNLLSKYHLRNFPKFKDNIERFVEPGSNEFLGELNPEKIFNSDVKRSVRGKSRAKSRDHSRLRYRIRKKTVKGRLIQKFRRLRRKLSIRKSTFSFPMENVAKPLLYIGPTKVLLTKSFVKKDIRVPYSIH